MIGWRKSPYSCPVVRVTRCGFLLQNSVKDEVEQVDSAE
jgi:hypothetical protein